MISFSNRLSPTHPLIITWHTPKWSLAMHAKYNKGLESSQIAGKTSTVPVPPSFELQAPISLKTGQLSYGLDSIITKLSHFGGGKLVRPLITLITCM